MNELFETGTLFATFDLGGYGHAVLKGNQHEVTAREAEFACQSWTLGIDGFLDDLHEQFLADFKCVGDASVLLQLRLDGSLLDGVEFLTVAYYLFQVFFVGEELTSQVKIVQEGDALSSYIDEAGVEPGHQLFHLCHIDVAYRERLRALLLLVFDQLFVFKECDRDVFRLHINDYFTCHFLAFLRVVIKTQKGVPLSVRGLACTLLSFLFWVTCK